MFSNIIMKLLYIFLFSTDTLEWSKLTTAEDSQWITASEILLGCCVDLSKKGLISTGLELVAGLGSCQESSRYQELQGVTCSNGENYTAVGCQWSSN